MAKNYELYDEDESAYYFTTGRITGGFMKSIERIAVCKLCGMEYPPFERHGPVDLTECIPRGIGSTNEGGVCTECGHRADKTLTFIYRELEYVDICEECLSAHHGLDYYELKYLLMKMVLNQWRHDWNQAIGRS